jgi:hypothetical protein
MLPATDATPSYDALSAFLLPPLAEIRVGTDLAKDPWGRLLEVLENTNARQNPSSSAADKSALRQEDQLSGMNPWLIDTIEIIDAQRQALNSVADKEQKLSLLDTAEMLASYICDIAPRRRPQLNIEPEGRPSFATALDDFYIHLTVDEPNKLTWYATVRGAEYFDEGVAFDGRKLPEGLKQLFLV